MDNGGQKVDLTMAYVGTRTVFERAGFVVKAADTGAVSGGFPRVLMRSDLAPDAAAPPGRDDAEQR